MVAPVNQSPKVVPISANAPTCKANEATRCVSPPSVIWNSRTITSDGMAFLTKESRQLDTFCQLFKIAQDGTSAQRKEAAQTLFDHSNKALVQIKQFDQAVKRAYVEAVETTESEKLRELMFNSTALVTFGEAAKDLSSRHISIVTPIIGAAAICSIAVATLSAISGMFVPEAYFTLTKSLAAVGLISLGILGPVAAAKEGLDIDSFRALEKIRSKFSWILVQPQPATPEAQPASA